MNCWYSLAPAAASVDREKDVIDLTAPVLSTKQLEVEEETERKESSSALGLDGNHEKTI